MFTYLIFSLCILFIIAYRRPLYFGPKSDHFDGIRFYNRNKDFTPKSIFDVLKWKISTIGKKNTWPTKIVNSCGNFQLFKKGELKSGINVINIGHMTFLIQVQNINIITDPVFSKAAGPFGIFGPKRIIDPCLKISDIDKIDVVLITHSHYDHLDMTSLKEIVSKHNPIIIVPLGLDSILHSALYTNKIIPLDWEESEIVYGIKIHLEEAVHWSMRSLFDKNKTLWGSYVIEALDKKILFTGDTAFEARVFENIASRHNNIDIAFIPCGAYEPYWFMNKVHMNPNDAIKASKIVNANVTIPTHIEVFKLSDEEYDDPRKTIVSLQNSINVKILDVGSSAQF
jgi:L-ascorbate metabolism protein UlaG (beta-lactamase superfamily)